MDADFGVVDFDLVDDGAQVRAAERDGAVRHILAHQGGKGVYLVLGDACFRLEFGEGAVFGGSRLIAVALQRCKSVLKRGVGCVSYATQLEPLRPVIEIPVRT